MTTKVLERKRNIRWDFYALGVTGVYLIFATPLIREYQRYALDRPFVTAALEVVDDGSGGVGILYDADAVVAVKGSWLATIYSGAGWRVADRRGPGRYTTEVDDPKPWTWHNFFQDASNGPRPAVPPFPFYVCVSYDVATSYGVSDVTEDFCSPVFNPNEVTK